MGRDKVKTSVATMPCSFTLEELTKSAKRSVEKIYSSHKGVAEDPSLLEKCVWSNAKQVQRFRKIVVEERNDHLTLKM